MATKTKLMKVKGGPLGRWKGRKKGERGGSKKGGRYNQSTLHALWKCQDETPYYVRFNICPKKQSWNDTLHPCDCRGSGDEVTRPSGWERLG
jgi:hypothetical protein